MSEAELNRVRQDLDTLKQAVGLEQPFSRDDVIGNLWLAACGVLLAAWGFIGPPPVRWTVLVPLGATILIAAKFSWQARRERARVAGRWREHRASLIAAALAVVLAVAWMQWERYLGVPREVVGAAAVFFVGAASLVLGVILRNRRHYFGWAVPLMLLGAALPFCSASARHVHLAAGLCFVLAGIATAAIQHRQLRTGAANHAAD